eukprot:338948-Amphidinium_carterae.1
MPRSLVKLSGMDLTDTGNECEYKQAHNGFDTQVLLQQQFLPNRLRDDSITQRKLRNEMTMKDPIVSPRCGKKVVTTKP